MTALIPHVPPATFYVDRGTIGPVSGLVPHVALGFYPDDESVALWDLAEWDDTTPGWADTAPLTDVTCDVVSVALVEGRDAPLERFRPSSLTVTLNDPDGLYSPWVAAPIPSTFSAIRVGIDLVYWVDIPAVSETHPRFRGIVTAIDETFPEMGDQHTVTFHATDYLSTLAAFDGVELAPQGAGEYPGARLTRIAQNAGYTGPTAFDPGTLPLQATTLAKNALDESGMVVDTEGGAYWCDRAGVLTFRDRNGLVSDPAYTTVQAIFGDAEVSTDSEWCYTDIELASDSDRIRNVVTISRAGGTAVTRSDLTSVSLYRARTFQRLDLIHANDADSPGIADRYVAVYAYASNRVDGLTVDMGTFVPSVAAAVLELDTLHMIEVRRRAQGFQVVAELQIQGVVENVTPTGWTIQFRTFSADSVFRVARWDTTAAKWDDALTLWGY